MYLLYPVTPAVTSSVTTAPVKTGHGQRQACGWICDILSRAHLCNHHHTKAQNRCNTTKTSLGCPFIVTSSPLVSTVPNPQQPLMDVSSLKFCHFKNVI